MAKVIAPEGFSLELDSQRMTFGHSADVEVPLLPELGVAEKHFTIVRFGQTHFIEHEADHTFPTRVNGEEISKRPLEDGDEICAGGLILTFCSEQDSMASAGADNTPEASLSPEIMAAVSGQKKANLPTPEPKEKPPLFDTPAEPSPSPPPSPELPKTPPAASLPPAPVAEAPTAPPFEKPVDKAPELPKVPSLPKPEAVDLIKTQAAPQQPTIPTPPPPAAPPEPAPPIEQSIPEITAPTTELPSSPLPAAPNKLPSATAPVEEPQAKSPEPAQVAQPQVELPSPPAAAPLPSPETKPPEVAAEHGAQPTVAPQEIPVVTPDPEEPENKKPGRETQRINLASAISSALTPKGPTPKGDPNIAPPSSVEKIEAQNKETTVPVPTPPVPSTAVPGPPASSTAVPGPQTNAPAPSVAIPGPTNPTPPAPISPAAPPAPIQTASPSTIAAPVSVTTPPVSQSAIQQPAIVEPVQTPAAAPSQPVATPPTAPVAPEAPAPLSEPEPSPAVTETPEPPAAAPAPVEEPTKAIKRPKRKRPRKPLFPFLRVFVPGLAMLALICAGGYYAWENHFKPEEKKREFVHEDRDSKEFPSADVIAQDVLKYLPANSEKAAFIDVQTAFSLWSATMNPNDEPMENPVDDFFFEATGLGLASVEYICVGGDATTENFVGVVGFSSDLNPAELFSGIERAGLQLVRVETIGEVPLRIMKHEGRELELVLVDQRTVLVSSAGKMRTAIQSAGSSSVNYSPVTASLGKSISDGASFAMTGSPQAIAITPHLESFGCPATPELLEQINEMETVSVTVFANTDIELSIGFVADSPEQAAQMVPSGSSWVAKAPQAVRDAFDRDFPDTPLSGAFDRFLESAEWASARKVNSLRMSATRRDLAKIVKEMQAIQPSDGASDEFVRREAQNFAGLFATGVSCGNPDLPKAGSVEKAMDMLIEGVRGRDKFSTVDIRFPYEPSKTELKAIARFLKWEDNKLLLIDESAARTAPPAMRRVDDEAQASNDPIRRTAKRYAKVYATAAAAGAINPDEITDVDAALKKLSYGVKGTGDFSDTHFQVNFIDERERSRAKKHLLLRDGRLDYVPAK